MSGGIVQALSGVGAAYAAVQVPMWAGLIRSRAALHHYVLSPLVAAPLTLIAVAGSAATGSLLVHLGLAAQGAGQLGIALGVSAVLGYAGGKGVGRGTDSGDRTYQRGTQVAESSPSPRLASRGRDASITLAGI